MEESPIGELSKRYKLPECFSKRVAQGISDGLITKTIRSDIITIIASPGHVANNYSAHF